MMTNKKSVKEFPINPAKLYSNDRTENTLAMIQLHKTYKV